ncbi:MAG TPA: Xaa-Pro dipeptidase [Xanthomonadaceae bacterium]|nr:Xaa-Pro dipeptidase [Xanthomonadaceae bacterium]
MSTDLAPLYADHVKLLQQRTEALLAETGHDHLLIASGRERCLFLDDRPYPFRANPHFLHWLPLESHSDGWLVISPGKRPHLLYHQPQDYWHLPPSDPEGFWVEHFDITILRRPEDAPSALPATAARMAVIGEPEWAVGDIVPDNPPQILHPLHFQRAWKSAYELECMRRANRRAVRGHLAAEGAFRAGLSEADIQRSYLAACQHAEDDTPYRNIVGLNEHAAVLHYQHRDAHPPRRHRTLLIDAGASYNGYAADITRTFTSGDALFDALIEAVDAVQRELVAGVRQGVDYRDLHIDAHRRLAGVLRDLDLVGMDPDVMVETGISAVFFPHGLGHYIGLQVHDVGGFMKNAAGELIDRPADHPYLRLTRTLEPDQVLTIEPGLYFIPMLLDELRRGPYATDVHWGEIERLLPFGGVRIEDDVRVTWSEPENLTRDAFALEQGLGLRA